jgi:hypothetical protein
MEKEQIRQYWTYAPGENAKWWNKDFENGVMSIGWLHNQSLDDFLTRQDIENSLINIGANTSPINKETEGSLSLWLFKNDVQIGDVIFATKGAKKVIAYGYVQSGYFYNEKSDYHTHFRKVEWHPTEVICNIGRGTLRRTGKPLEYLKEVYGLDDFLSSNQETKDIINIENDKTISETERKILVAARLGQGRFKKDVCNIENGCCRVTGVDDIDFLIASHIKPWCKSNHEERLDKYNGFLLSPHIDKLFDRGYISFEDNGDMLVSEKAKEVIQIWNIHIINVGTFHSKQKEYLKWHRTEVFNKRNGL